MSGLKAAFLDRDGVINRDHGYTYRIEDFEFLDGVFDACRRLKTLDYRIVIVTNQSGIGRGYFSEADFQRLNDWMLARFAQEGIDITGVYYCPYHPEHGIGEYRRESPHRKPGPQMIVDAARDYGLDLRASFIAGDSLGDIQAGQAAGLGACYFIGNVADLPAEYRDIKAYGSLLKLIQSEFN